MTSITVKAPASVSNVVCGFDCLGFAITEPYDVITLTRLDRPEIVILPDERFGLPTDPEKNIAGVALNALVEASGIDHGFEIKIDKTIKPGSGIGSSAASVCGTVFAANKLLDDRFSVDDLIEFAMAGEMAASGSRHADNVAPCMLGGFTLVRSVDPLDIIKLNSPELTVVVLHPQIEIRTADARALLPAAIALHDAVGYWSNLGAFVAALNAGDHGAMSRAMADEIIEPVRQKLIPRFESVRNAAMDAGAIGGGISGSGPSLFFLCADGATANMVETAAAKEFARNDISFNTYVSPIERVGVSVI